MNEQQQQTAVSVDETAGKKRSRISRKWRFGTVATVTTAVVIAAVILLNVVMDVIETRYPLTLDLTADGTYTLCEESITLARGVEKDVEIAVFVNESLFTANDYSAYQDLYAMAQYIGNDYMMSAETVLEQFYNMLKQYQMESNGKVTYRFIDLDANPALASQYQEYGVETGTVLFLCEGRYQTFTLLDLLSMNADYTNYTMTYTSEAERMVAAKINLVSASVVKRVTVLTGHDEVEDVISNVTSLLSNNGCEVTTLDITASAPPDEATDVFVIPAAASDYTVEEIARLREWLNNGGKREKDLLVLTNPVSRLPNLYEMLADEYGIQVCDQIVCETDANNVYNMNTYYTYADVESTDYTEEFLDKRALMPLTRPLKLLITDSNEESTFAKPLVSFGETAQVQDLTTALSDEGSSAEQTATAAESYPIVGAAYTKSRLFDNNDDQYYTTDVMVFGSAMFAYANTMDITSACNEDLFLSTFRGLTGLESVISVSSRSLTQKTLDFGGSLVPQVLGTVFMAVLPLAFVVAAIVVFVRRRRL